MKLTKSKMEEVVGYTGYECDVCHKKVNFVLDFLPQSNTITWSHPSGGWGESYMTEIIDVCSMPCLMKALKEISGETDIHLSNDFIRDNN